jgi:hypothetical protein
MTYAGRVTPAVRAQFRKSALHEHDRTHPQTYRAFTGAAYRPAMRTGQTQDDERNGHGRDIVPSARREGSTGRDIRRSSLATKREGER